MVNYPTILGLPQEDIDRQLYVGVLGLESRVKALENKPNPILEITVTDESSVAISGASVVIGETSKSTGDDGKATFQLAYGDYEATISAEGYTTATEELQFRSNHKNFEIELEAASSTGTVTVTVEDSEQQPLKATNLFLCNTDQLDPEDDSNWVAIEDSGPSGTATLTIYDTATHQPTEETAIPFGSYYLFAIKANFETYSSALTVDGDETVTITLTSE